MLRPDRTVPCVYLHRAPVDLRKQQVGLAALVQEAMSESPFSGALFAFTNKRRNKLKLIYWEKNGFVIWYKSLCREQFHWPRHLDEAVVTLSGEQLNWLLDGYDVWVRRESLRRCFSVAQSHDDDCQPSCSRELRS